MFSRILPGGVAVAVVGAAMLAMTATSASAFTLSAPSLESSVASADVEAVYWHHGWHHGWHDGWHHRMGWGGGWHRHCWRGYYGHLHCHVW
jgi:hypothetical protein